MNQKKKSAAFSDSICCGVTFPACRPCHQQWHKAAGTCQLLCSTILQKEKISMDKRQQAPPGPYSLVSLLHNNSDNTVWPYNNTVHQCKFDRMTDLYYSLGNHTAKTLPSFFHHGRILGLTWSQKPKIHQVNSRLSLHRHYLMWNTN